MKKVGYVLTCDEVEASRVVMGNFRGLGVGAHYLEIVAALKKDLDLMTALAMENEEKVLLLIERVTAGDN